MNYISSQLKFYPDLLYLFYLMSIILKINQLCALVMHVNRAQII